jgi:hypothetical protein
VFSCHVPAFYCIKDYARAEMTNAKLFTTQIHPLLNDNPISYQKVADLNPKIVYVVQTFKRSVMGHTSMYDYIYMFFV